MSLIWGWLTSSESGTWWVAPRSAQYSCEKWVEWCAQESAGDHGLLLNVVVRKDVASSSCFPAKIKCCRLGGRLHECETSKWCDGRLTPVHWQYQWYHKTAGRRIRQLIDNVIDGIWIVKRINSEKIRQPTILDLDKSTWKFLDPVSIDISAILPMIQLTLPNHEFHHHVHAN